MQRVDRTKCLIPDAKEDQGAGCSTAVEHKVFTTHQWLKSGHRLSAQQPAFHKGGFAYNLHYAMHLIRCVEECIKSKR